MSRVVHFEFAGQEPARAVKFYSEVFGWKSQVWPGGKEYHLVTTGPDSQPGINGGILRHDDGAPRTVCTIGVENLEASLKKIEAANGKVVVPKMPIPGVGWLAYCTDTEGMIFGVHQEDPSAA